MILIIKQIITVIITVISLIIKNKIGKFIPEIKNLLNKETTSL